MHIAFAKLQDSKNLDKFEPEINTKGTERDIK